VPWNIYKNRLFDRKQAPKIRGFIKPAGVFPFCEIEWDSSGTFIIQAGILYPLFHFWPKNGYPKTSKMTKKGQKSHFLARVRDLIGVLEKSGKKGQKRRKKSKKRV